MVSAAFKMGSSAFFRGTSINLVVDGFPGVKKFREDLSLACRGRKSATTLSRNC